MGEFQRGNHRVVGALIASALVVLVGGCGDGGDTTIINTTVTEPSEPAAEDPLTTTTTTTSAATTPAQEEEYSGRCSSETKAIFPVAGKPGFQDLRTLEAQCEYALQVATAWVADYGPDCYSGCTRTVKGIRCQSDVSEVKCFAARTQVEFSLEQSD